VSALLDSLLPAEKLADIASNDSAMDCGPLRLFTVSFGPRNAPRLTFPVMARSSFQVTERHLCLAMPQERMDVVEVKRG
jgi:hypothetical protein